MLAEILKTNPVDHLGFNVTLQNLSVTLEKFSFNGIVSTEQTISTGLSLLVKSGSRAWTFDCNKQTGNLIFEGHLPTKELANDISLTFCFNNIRYLWLVMKLNLSDLDKVTQWISYFAGYKKLMPDINLGRLARQILDSAELIYAVESTNKFADFCEHVKGIDFVVHLAHLRRDGRFPAISAGEDGVVLGSKLVSAWNVLIVQEAEQRLFVFQGVSSCDAVFIPGLNTLIIVCHITRQQVFQCLKELEHSPEFFKLVKHSMFLGYLVGHSRPYHCNYDSLLALQHIREEGELLAEDALYSKSDEAFIDLGSGLELVQKHQYLSRSSLNKMTEKHNGYLLKLGSWFWCDQKPNIRSLELAIRVDQSLRKFASNESTIASSGALAVMEECQPLLWVGITGQKRCWIEQVEGTVNILNTLYEYYPRMGIIFDGWTPPLSSSNYHRSESRKDSEIIQKIIKNLKFRNQGRFGIIVGQTMLEKIRVGMSVDLFMANYTTGSINIARICQKPGVGHMSRKMASHRSQHIHYRTREIDTELVQDQDDSQTLAGYINYSLPWQAIYNELIKILGELNIKPSKIIKPLDIIDYP